MQPAKQREYTDNYIPKELQQYFGSGQALIDNNANPNRGGKEKVYNYWGIIFLNADTQYTNHLGKSDKRLTSLRKYDRTVPITREEQPSAISRIIDFVKRVKYRVERVVIGGITKRQAKDFADNGIEVNETWVHSFESSTAGLTRNITVTHALRNVWDNSPLPLKTILEFPTYSKAMTV